MSDNKTERRRSRRRPILDSFMFFVVVPKKGMAKLNVADVSDSGVGFDYDVGPESKEDFPVKVGEEFELHLYVNQSLFLPMKVKVARLDEKSSIRRIGAQFTNIDSPEHRGLMAVLQMVDQLVESGRFQSSN